MRPLLSLFVLTLGDLIGAVLLALLLIGVAIWFVSALVQDWWRGRKRK